MKRLPPTLVQRANHDGYVLMTRRDFTRAVCTRSHRLRDVAVAVASRAAPSLLIGFCVGLFGGLAISVLMELGT